MPQIVRCRAKQASPFLRRCCAALHALPVNSLVVDVGAGGGRNMDYVKAQAPDATVVGLDARSDRPDIVQMELTPYSTLPFADGAVNMVLCQFLLMFLDRSTRTRLALEIMRVAAPNAVIMLEVFPAKTSLTPSGLSAARVLRDFVRILVSQGARLTTSNTYSCVLIQT